LAAGQKLTETISNHQHFFSQLHNRDGLVLPYGKAGFSNSLDTNVSSFCVFGATVIAVCR